MFYLGNDHSFRLDVPNLQQFFFPLSKYKKIILKKIQENHSRKKYKKMYDFLLNTRHYFQETISIFAQNKLNHDNLFS